MAQERKTSVIDRTQCKAHLVGGGIASLAAAAFLIKEGDLSGNNIYIYEEQSKAGGSLDANGDADKGYVLHGGRMFEKNFTSTLELLSFVPSITNSAKTAKQELLEFQQEFGWNGTARLVSGGEIEDITSWGFSARDRLEMTELLAVPEDLIGKKRINDWFRAEFFQTNFWLIWSTTFGFEPWHSASEFKRSVRRFSYLASNGDRNHEIFRTKYNQYDAIVRPLVRWLAERGVHFEMSCQVSDMDFRIDEKSKTVEKIHLNRNGHFEAVEVGEYDLVLVTNGSITAAATFGGMDAAPVLETSDNHGAWELWEKLSLKNSDFGNPEVFNKSPGQTKWESFTVTAKDSRFFDLVAKFSGGQLGQGSFVTIKDSHWKLSLVLGPQPHFYDQPKDTWVWWGYGLYPDKVGNFVRKKMSDCSGREILTEVLSHFHFMDEIPPVLQASICIPCVLPYITSQYMPRGKGDRPLVFPKGSTNLAFIGQFCELPDEMTFTVEYSVRSAQTAVYALLGLPKEVPSYYKGAKEDLSAMFDAMKNLNRGYKRPEPSEKRL